jgi:hypothetical protein
MGSPGKRSAHGPRDDLDLTAPAFLHSRCVQWMEKTVDNHSQALRCNAFKIMANFSPAHRAARRTARLAGAAGDAKHVHCQVA